MTVGKQHRVLHPRLTEFATTGFLLLRGFKPVSRMEQVFEQRWLMQLARVCVGPMRSALQAQLPFGVLRVSVVRYFDKRRAQPKLNAPTVFSPQWFRGPRAE